MLNLRAAVGCTPTMLATDPDLRARYPWLPVTKSGVVRSIKAGRIPATRYGTRWIIDLDALDRTAAAHRDA